MAKINWNQMNRDNARFQADIDQRKADLREVIAEMGGEWAIAILETCSRIDDDNCRPPLPALARFAEVGLMSIIAEVDDGDGLY